MSFEAVITGKLRTNGWTEAYEVIKAGRALHHDMIQELLAQVVANVGDDVPIIIVASSDEQLIDWVKKGRPNSATIVPVRWNDGRGFYPIKTEEAGP